MSTRPLDSTAGVSPLDALMAPAQRDNLSDGTFAQHFSAATTSAPRSVATPRAEDPAAPKPERREKPAESQDESITTNSTVASAESQSREREEPTATSSTDTGDQHAPKTPVAEASEDAPAAEIEDEAVDEESVDDELLLTCMAPAAQPPAPAEVVETAQSAETTEETKVAAIAEEDSGAPQSKRLPSPKTTKPAVSTAAANAAVAVDHPSVDETQEVGKGAASAADPDVSIPDVTTVATAEAIEGVATDPVAAQSTALMPTEQKSNAAAKTIRSRAAKDQADSTNVEELKANVTAEADPDVNIEQLQDSEKPRESKRDRLRADSRNRVAENGALTNESTGQPNGTAATSAETLSTTIATTGSAPEARATGDLSIPTPVAAAPATATISAGSAPQSLQRLPQHLLARPASPGSRGAPPNPAEQARFVTRVAKAFQTAQARGGELQLRLSPAELGSLKIEIKLTEGVMSARVEAESTNAKNLLMDNLPVLKERLAEQGIVIEKFDVELMDRQPQGQPDTAQERERRHAPRGTIKTKAEEATATPVAASEARALRSDGRLNVTV